MTIKPEIIEGVPSPDDLQFLEDRLYEYNSAVTGKNDGELFSFFIRNEQQEAVAGLAGWVWAQACEILTLWVHPEWRGQDFGQRLLKAAEGKAREHGCLVILIRTYSFQAPDFYKKQGYELAWQLDDFPPGRQQSFFTKRFPQT